LRKQQRVDLSSQSDQRGKIGSRFARILPVRYFHVVFTLPEALRAWVRANRAALFALLFRAASDALLTLARDAKWLSAVDPLTRENSRSL